MLNIIFLIQEELPTQPILYLSRHIIAHKADYYHLLPDTTRTQEWEAWLILMPREKQVGKEKLFIHPILVQLRVQDGNTYAPHA